jgi:asparagine synthase (glutamine-hydrolysing)
MLLHARLSILDLSPAGNQPMTAGPEGPVIVFNGEIYNYRELREELIKEGFSFTTHSDTEVVLAAYRRWGVECVHRFNGMWAFAVWDTDRRQLFLSRDRLGVKPLFYTFNHHQGCFAFASEIKALLALPGIDPAPDLARCQDYIIFDAEENTDATFFRNIHRLPPAHNLVLDIADGTIEQDRMPRRYWDLLPFTGNAAPRASEEKALTEEFYSLFFDAVKIRLQADVGVGTALSGGLDSSSSVYVINQLLKQDLAPSIGERQCCFSSVFSKPGETWADESPYINLVTETLNVRSVKVTPTPERLLRELESMVYHQDEPFGSTSIFAQWCVFSLPRQHNIIVTLDGQGADEQTAGYFPYLGAYWSSLALHDPILYREIWGARRMNGAFHQALLPFLTVKARSFLGRRFSTRVSRNLNARLLEAVFGARTKEIYGSYIERRPEGIALVGQHFNEKLAYDTKNRLPVLLRYADRNSMAFGVESRGPYLDYRLVEFVAGLPAGYKINGGWTKWIARKAFEGKLPEAIVWRRDKMGFPTPERIWFAGELRPWAEGILKNSSFIEQVGVRKNIAASYDALCRSNMLWKVLNLELWARVFHVS